jgi:AGCS family alanine or glycine:cation symporter
MAAIYVAGALTILVLNIGDVPAAFGRIFSEAFNPTSGVAGTGAGVFLLTMLYGVQRGLFSNEAGQGSAPIAHSAAKTDEPVSEGVVALLEPFIDTILICTMTGLVLVTTGAFEATAPAEVDLSASNVSLVEGDRESGFTTYSGTDAIPINEGIPQALDGPRVGRFGVGIDTLFADEAQTIPFTGTIDPETRTVLDNDGNVVETLYGNTVRTSAPLTTLAFERGLDPIGLGGLGRYIVLLSVVLFAVSTSISWSYYGDRCANYLFGTKAILPFKGVFVVMHFVGAVLAVTTIWDLGDVALSLVTLPNVLALLLLSPVLKKLTDSYFERRPWEQNELDHKRAVEEGRLKR